MNWFFACGGYAAQGFRAGARKPVFGYSLSRHFGPAPAEILAQKFENWNARTVLKKLLKNYIYTGTRFKSYRYFRHF